MASTRESRPAPVEEEMLTTGASGRRVLALVRPLPSASGRSSLLYIIMDGLPCAISRSSLSSEERAVLRSSTISSRSALLKASLLRSMPMLSTLSEESLIPAVSTKRRVSPRRLICSSMVSLVVPGISVTMLLSSLKRRFIREDFPTLGLPTMAVRSPSLTILPSEEDSFNFNISSFIDDRRSINPP